MSRGAAPTTLQRYEVACQAAVSEALSTLLAVLSRACWMLHCFSPRLMPTLQTVTCRPMQQLDCRVSWPGLLWRLAQTWVALGAADPAEACRCLQHP